VARERRLNGDLRSLRIADFTHQNNVGILAQNSAQTPRKSQIDRCVDVNLDDAVELIFHGVFRGDDLFGGVVDLVEGGIQSCGFAATRGAGNQQNAVGPLDHLQKAIENVLRHADLMHADAHHVLVQQTHGHGLAVNHGQCRKTNVHVAPVHGQFHTPVLGAAGFRNIEVRHNLEARENADLPRLRRAGNLAQHTVHAVTDAEYVAERFEVNITRALLDGLQKEQAAETDNGLVGTDLFEVAQVNGAGCCYKRSVVVIPLEVVHQILQVHVAHTVVQVDVIDDLFLVGNHGFQILHLAPGEGQA